MYEVKPDKKRQEGIWRMKAAEKQQLAKVQKRLDSGELADQKCWSFIRELNSYSEERLESIAIHDS